MKTARDIIVLLIMVLTIHGCQTNNIKHEAGVERASTGEELILKGRVSVPLPESYKKVLLDEHAMIISAPEYSVVYRWIDQNEVEFIGSNKSPYDFFKSVFSNPTSDEEKRFLEGLKNEVHRPNSPSDLEFYYFDNGDGRQIYILSNILSFVLEVTYKGDDDNKYINSVVADSQLR
ncbi:hypothetical protein [Marinimicrobium locisalis]|uniref:hypothetical protein n=1 Tax=Marinimicrobium locisalis TaxID=546022 RepID=UPI0032220178